MRAWRPVTLLAGAAILTLSSSAPALSPAPAKITAAGVGSVKLGRTYQQLHAAHRLGPVRPGCELAGPSARSASLRSPLVGSVDLTATVPHRVATIAVTGRAAARGVGIGASGAAVKRAFPKVVFDHRTDAMFNVTLARVPAGGGGRLQFAIDTATGRVTLIGIPNVAFCE